MIRSIAKFGAAAAVAVALGAALGSVPAAAQSQSVYEMVAPPATDFNAVYRLNTNTGEIHVCWYESGSGLGSARCLPAGQGAGPGAPGKYSILPSNMSTERGVFRLNRQTGELSVCYYTGSDASSWKTVCTAPAK